MLPDPRQCRGCQVYSRLDDDPYVSHLQLERFADYRGGHQIDVYGIIFATSAVALSYNVVHSLMIQQTSAVTTTVLGEAKIIGLMLLSYLVLGVLHSLPTKQLIPADWY